MKISIIIPCFNEKNTILKIIEKVKRENNYQKEIIVIDDFSTDGTREILQEKIRNNIDRLILNEKNLTFCKSNKLYYCANHISFIKHNL